jgi:hypothetical protein
VAKILSGTGMLKAGFLKLVVRDTCLTAADKYLLFIKDLLVISNQYFWWASKI